MALNLTATAGQPFDDKIPTASVGRTGGAGDSTNLIEFFLKQYPEMAGSFLSTSPSDSAAIGLGGLEKQRSAFDEAARRSQEEHDLNMQALRAKIAQALAGSTDNAPIRSGGGGMANITQSPLYQADIQDQIAKQQQARQRENEQAMLTFKAGLLKKMLGGGGFNPTTTSTSSDRSFQDTLVNNAGAKMIVPFRSGSNSTKSVTDPTAAYNLIASFLGR